MLARMAWSMFRSIPSLSIHADVREQTGANLMVTGAVLSLSTPYWTLWWATIGLGYILYSARLGPAGVAVFLCRAHPRRPCLVFRHLAGHRQGQEVPERQVLPGDHRVLCGLPPRPRVLVRLERHAQGPDPVTPYSLSQPISGRCV
jgi:hypothetical protein